MTKVTNIECVLFDLGGVLIELNGPPVSPANTDLSEADIWHRWLKSKAVRRFESGKCTQDEFAAQLIEEFELSISKQQLLSEFHAWPLGFFPEAEGIIAGLQNRVQIGCLSNTNDLHWERFQAESSIYDQLDHQFISFKMGLLKPDPNIFHAVQAELGFEPEQVLFLDDNLLNVETAQQQGWRAVQTKGPSEVLECLKQHDLL